jgi:iron complex outermembrane recepter protein
MRRALLVTLFLLQTVVLVSVMFAANNDKRDFDVPAGDAGRTLKRFAQQAHREIMFPAESVSGIKTNALKGKFTVREALDRMLAGTSLRATEDDKTGALVIVCIVPTGAHQPGAPLRISQQK